MQTISCLASGCCYPNNGPTLCSSVPITSCAEVVGCAVQ
jgi:hypothetical protein